MSEVRDRLAAMKAGGLLAVGPIVRQQYGIRLTSGQWAGFHRHWVTKTRHALAFDFVTSAEAYATMVLALSPAQFTVEEL